MIDLQNELNSLTVTNLPIPLPSVSLTDIAVTGQFEVIKGGLATVVVSGSIGKNRVHAVFQKPLKAGKFSGAFTAEIESIKLSELIKKTQKVDISRVPFFGSLTIPKFGVTVSSDYITSSLLPNVFCKEGLLQNTAVTIPKGLQAFTTLSFSGTKVPIKMQYYKTFLSFEVINNGQLQIGTIVKTILDIDIRKLSLPRKVKDIFQFQINYFSIDTSTKQLVVSTQYPDTLSYFNGYLTIINPALSVNADLLEPKKTNIETSGAIRIGKGYYSVTISKDADNYILKASFKKIPVSEFITTFSASVLPSELQQRVKNFIQFSIENAKLSFPLGSAKLQVHLSGKAVVYGYRVQLCAVICSQGKSAKLVAGFQFGTVSLKDLIFKITAKDLSEYAILNQELDISILISPVYLSNVHLPGSKLKDMDIMEGVSINADLRWPNNCARDKFCDVARKLLGKDAKFSLQATIKSITSFTMSARVKDITLREGVVLTSAAIQVKVGGTTSLGIEGSINLKKHDLTLSAGIRLEARQVILKGDTTGCWKNAFGANWLSICNLHLEVKLLPTATIEALQLGGEVKIGDPKCITNPLTAEGYVGVDEFNLNNNFYYVELKNKVTMGTLLKAVCINLALPRSLSESGFPNGFLSSFSTSGKKLPQVIIPAGFRLNGTINILGLQADADVTISLSEGVNMDVALSPLKIANGKFEMYASSKDRSRGPLLKVCVTIIPSLKVDIHASGFVSVLGIQAEAMLKVTDTQYEFTVEGKLFNAFQASLKISADYGDITKAGFQVAGELKNDFFTKVHEKIENGIQKYNQVGEKMKSEARENCKKHQDSLNKAVEKRDSARNRVNSAQNDCDRAARCVKDWETKLERLPRPSRCKKSK